MFRFTEDCILGNEDIDAEHRHLFDLLNNLIELAENAYGGDRYTQIKDMLAELDEYADQHFTHEEEYMASICDPELILQRMQHYSFREKVLSFSLMNIDSDEDQQEAIVEMGHYLAKWLYHHIIGSDLLIGKLPPLEEWMLRENPCEFTEEYFTGIELIDREHEALFEIVGKANALVRDWNKDQGLDDVMKLLEELKEYTEFHFADEEEYMRAVKYDGYEAQKRAHDAFIARLEDIDFEKIQEDPQAYLQSLMVFLLGWLINHILHSDKKIPMMDEV